MKLTMFSITTISASLLLLSFTNLEVKCEEVGSKATIVELEKQGKLQGISLTSRKGREYFGFLGVPFGKVPERFAPPEPADEWDGIKNVQKLPPPCFQFNIFVQQIIGVEDCLMLNVYSPKLDGKLPVIVFNTPGGFQIGGASLFEGKYIMDQDVVFVSINNRLGALGFLNTGDGVVSGNMGMKDQVLALKWIQEHIHKFGGDANSVTFSGISAGGAAVNYHMLSTMSKGLIHRGISLSGSALNPWAFQPNPKLMAQKLAENADCVRDTSEEMVKCLREKEPNGVLNAQLRLSKLSPEFDLINMKFVPSVESPDAKGPRFLTDTPYNLITRGEITNKVPWISGVTENEGSFYIALIMAQEKSVEKLNKDWYKMAPNIWYYDDTTPAGKLDAVSRKIHDFYFGSKGPRAEAKRNLSNIFTDRFFANGIVKAMQLQAKHQPIYPYILDYDGKYSGIQFDFGDAVKERDGVAHADELLYMFNGTLGYPEIELGTEDGDFSEKYLKLWASFAKDGKPTATWGPQKEWKPLDPKKSRAPMKFYDLDMETGLIDDPFIERRELWEGLPLKEDENSDLVDKKEEL